MTKLIEILNFVLLLLLLLLLLLYFCDFILHVRYSYLPINLHNSVYKYFPKKKYYLMTNVTAQCLLKISLSLTII